MTIWILSYQMVHSSHQRWPVMQASDGEHAIGDTETKDGLLPSNFLEVNNNDNKIRRT